MAQDSEPENAENGAAPAAGAGLPLLRRVPLSNLQIILIALIIVGGRLVIDFSQRIVEGQRKIAEQRYLEAQIATLLQEGQDLEAAKAYYSSPAFVEAWAHDQGKMVKDGEVLVIPLYSGQPQTGIAISSPPEVTRSLPAWYIWWTLFFDGPPPFSQTSPP